MSLSPFTLSMIVLLLVIPPVFHFIHHEGPANSVRTIEAHTAFFFLLGALLLLPMAHVFTAGLLVADDIRYDVDGYTSDGDLEDCLISSHELSGDESCHGSPKWVFGLIASGVFMYILTYGAATAFCKAFLDSEGKDLGTWLL